MAKYQLNPSSYIFTKVNENLIKRMYDVNCKIEDILSSEGVALLYQIKPELNPELPPKERCSKTDSNYGINQDQWSKCVVNFLQP